MTEEDLRLWERVCATVRKFGDKNPKQPSEPLVLTTPLDFYFIDLHGETVQDAYCIAKEFLENTKFKAVTVVTGKSGQIRAEFPRWMDTLGYRYIIVNGDGAFRINTKRLAPPRR